MVSFGCVVICGDGGLIFHSTPNIDLRTSMMSLGKKALSLFCAGMLLPVGLFINRICLRASTDLENVWLETL